MNPDPTIAISLDYLVELSDDASQADQPEPEVILIPPASPGTALSPAAGGAPDQGP